MRMETVALRQWKDEDFDAYAEMNANAEVMRYLPAPLSRFQASRMFIRMRRGIDARGWGTWAVEVDGVYAGMAGLNVPRRQLPFSPCTEVLWRFRREFWGRGIAFRAAALALDYGFSKIGVEEIVAFTTTQNLRSIRLMERLGLTRDLAGDFDHPAVPDGHPLRRHVLYRKKRSDSPPFPLNVCPVEI